VSTIGDQIISDFRNFISEFKSETDRAIVVLTAARLDYLLLSILQKRLIPNTSKSDEFFENQGPGSSFSNKIMLSYRMGLIDRDFTRALHLVRSIRNDFAHETSVCSLERGSHKDRVNTLVAPYRKLKFFSYFKNEFIGNVQPSREDFMTVVGFLILRLHYLYENLDAINDSDAWPVINDNMKNFVEPPKQVTTAQTSSGGTK